ncbi:hypothetical protein HZA97_09675 [Candidatus Woesearchaeota archaeon]|nr:hypothetical protein [Candidatus Woesearchaeota archaeon]
MAKKNKKELEQFEGKITAVISPAGDTLDDLVYEPLGNKEYVWKAKDGRKGIGKAKQVEKDEETIWVVDFNDEIYKLRDAPLTNLFFQIPRQEKIQSWLDNKYKPKKGLEIYEEIKSRLKVFVDLPAEQYYDTLILGVIQSWLANVLPHVFYLGVTGGFGCGKTALLELIEKLSYHGFQSGNISKAAIPRIIQAQKLSILVDEVDVGGEDNDNELYLVLRQGYRKNNYYVRCNPKTLMPERFDVYGFKTFTYHGDVETALKSRTLPIHIAESDDARLSVINMYKHVLKDVFEDLFFFYMENILEIRETVDSVDSVAPVASIFEGSTDKSRDILFQVAVKNFTQNELNFLKSFKGRNTELGFVGIKIARVVGLEILDSLKESFEIKDEENETDNYSTLARVKKELLARYEAGLKTTSRKEGIVWCTYGEIYESLNEFSKELGQKDITSQELNKHLKNLGFIHRVNKKKSSVENKGTVLCLFFDNKVVKKIKPLEETSNTSNNEQQSNTKEELKQKILLLDYYDGADEEKLRKEFLNFDELIDVLKTSGEVYSPKSGKWKVL